MIADGQANHAAFTEKLPMPMLSGERGIPQAQTLACVEQVVRDIDSDIVPGSGHSFALDNPDWVAARMARFVA